MKGALGRWLDDEVWQKRWATISAITTAISLVAAVIAAAFAASEYYRAGKAERVARVMEFVKTWDDEEMRTARDVLRDRIAELNEAFAIALPPEQLRAERDAFRLNIGEKAIEGWNGGKKVEPQVDRLLDFLNGVGFCVTHDLCDRDVATAYFRPFSASMFSYFAGYVGQRRSGEPKYAEYAERLRK